MSRSVICWLLMLLFVGSLGYSQPLIVSEFSYDKVPFFQRFGHKEEGDVGRKKLRVVDMYAPDDSCQYLSDEYEIKRIEGDGYSRLVLNKRVSYFKISHPSHGSFYWKMPLKKLKRWRGYKAVLESSNFKEYHPKTQWLVISTNPRECVVSVDTICQRISDGRMQLQLPLGKHSIEVQAPFFEGVVDSVTLTNHETLYYDVALQPIYSYLSIDSGSQSADISIDGGVVGKGRVERIRVAPGSITVGVVEDGYEPYFQQVELTSLVSESVVIDYPRVPIQPSSAAKVSGGEDAIPADTVETKSPVIAKVEVSVKGYDKSCDIYVNNEFYGRGEWSGVLDSGLYAFDNRRDGFSSKPMFVEVGVNPSILVELSSPLAGYGVINLSTDIAGALIFINGESVGRSPMIIKELEADRVYTVQVQLAGYRTMQQQVKVKANAEVKVDFKFNK
ncbi:MAG: PEGA domain-containing protein [Rikenellaceae bacterium]